MQVQHQRNGRVGPPRCYECNAPLGLDDAAFAEEMFSLPDFSRFLCNDCRGLQRTAPDYPGLRDCRELRTTQQRLRSSL